MQKQSMVTIIVGSQWGDEGKGKITDFFAGECDYVVRFQGGPNAGHTVNVQGKVYKLHHIPSGVLYSRPISVIGSGVVINPQVLLKEIESLRSEGIEPRLKISERAHVIMPYHITMDACLTTHQGTLAAGSTLRGIAPVFADKMYRHGIRMGDLIEPEIFREKLKKSYEFNKSIIVKVFNQPFETTEQQIYESYFAFGEHLKSYITDTELELYRAYCDGKAFLFEAAQGLSLDVDQGLYPHTTSSTTLAGHIAAGAGVTFNGVKKIIGVAKAYLTRVGNSPFTTEIFGEQAEVIRERGKEYGTTTGRPRRIGNIDFVQLRQAVRVNGLTEIALTKLDVLSGLSTLDVCVAYKLDGKEIDETPASLHAMRNVKPVYATMKGWGDIPPEVLAAFQKNDYDVLPREVRDFIAFLEKEVNCRVSIVSLSPERSCTLVRS